MPDITMCRGEGCGMKERCFRYLADPSHYQSFFVTSPNQGKECEHFWEVNPDLDQEKPIDNLVD